MARSKRYSGKNKTYGRKRLGKKGASRKNSFKLKKMMGGDNYKIETLGPQKAMEYLGKSDALFATLTYHSGGYNPNPWSSSNDDKFVITPGTIFYGTVGETTKKIYVYYGVDKRTVVSRFGFDGKPNSNAKKYKSFNVMKTNLYMITDVLIDPTSRLYQGIQYIPLWYLPNQVPLIIGPNGTPVSQFVNLSEAMANKYAGIEKELDPGAQAVLRGMNEGTCGSTTPQNCAIGIEIESVVEAGVVKIKWLTTEVRFGQSNRNTFNVVDSTGSSTLSSMGLGVTLKNLKVLTYDSDGNAEVMNTFNKSMILTPQANLSETFFNRSGAGQPPPRDESVIGTVANARDAAAVTILDNIKTQVNSKLKLSSVVVNNTLYDSNAYTIGQTGVILGLISRAKKRDQALFPNLELYTNLNDKTIIMSEKAKSNLALFSLIYRIFKNYFSCKLTDLEYIFLASVLFAGQSNLDMSSDPGYKTCFI